MAITASMVKELRERTGAGMMDCKKALQDANGDMDQAIEEMRKSGIAKAEKKSGRIAAEGIINIVENGNKAVMVEVNCETDFVAKDENFQAFVQAVTNCIAENEPADIEALSAMTLDGQTVEETRQALIQKIGENMNVRRFTIAQATGLFGSYRHGNRIGVLVDITGGDEALAKDIAMHIAGHDPAPICVNSDEIPQELLDKEKDIFMAQAAESGKPQDIIEKMVVGKLNKYKKEISLLDQNFVKDPDQTISQLLKSASASINSFIRYQVGEGMEKKQDNFADEVMSQAGLE